MKLRLSFLLCLFALVSGSAFGTSIPVRSTGAYGVPPSIGPIGSGLDGGSNFQEVVVCQAGFTSDGCAGSGPYDMLLAFTDDTQDGHAFTLDLPTFTLASTTNNGSSNSFIPNTFTFGVLTCGAQTAVNNGTMFCTDLSNPTLNTDATNCENALAGEFDSLGNFTGTTPITISGACVASGMTLYFDETGANVAAPNFNSGTSPAPEPGSLLLLGSGLLALAGRFRRILPA